MRRFHSYLERQGELKVKRLKKMEPSLTFQTFENRSEGTNGLEQEITSKRNYINRRGKKIILSQAGTSDD